MGWLQEEDPLFWDAHSPNLLSWLTVPTTKWLRPCTRLYSCISEPVTNKLRLKAKLKTGDIFQTVKKFRKITSHVERHVFCAHVKFHIKSTLFMLCVKKTNECLGKWIILAQFFFCTRHKICRFLLKQLHKYVTCKELHETFLFLFDIFKYDWNAFQIKVAYCRGWRNTLSR
jgi:hypothetical protein